MTPERIAERLARACGCTCRFDVDGVLIEPTECGYHEEQRDALARAQQEIADLREAYVGDVAMSYDYFAKARPQKTYGFYLSFDSREAAAKAHQWLAPRTPGE